MKKAIRIITFSDYDAHTAPLFKALNILNFQQTIKFHTGKLMYDVKNRNLPNFLLNIFNIDVVTKSNRKVILSKKYTPLSRTKYKDCFISTTGLIIWNILPDKIKNVKTKKCFSSKYHKYLLSGN